MTQMKRKRIIQQAKTDYTNEYVKHQLRFYYEQKLALEVSKIFAKMEKRILQELQEYYNPGVMYKAQVEMILSPIHELHREYFETILKYQLKEYDNARATGRKIVQYKIGFKKKNHLLPKTRVLKADLTDAVTSTINKDELFGTLDVSHYDLEQRTYALCENTLRRVDSDINNIVANGYREGMGIDKVGRDITNRFGQLKTWEANRIARTEIHISHNQGLMQGYYDMDVEYLEWSTSIDGRERDTHRELNGEIIPIGGTFSNDLHYPGDSSGIPSEIINCRCQALPFIIPYGYIAPPGMARFRESDLVATLDYFNADDLVAQAMAESDQIPELTNEELNAMSFQEIADYYGLEYRGESYNIVDKVKEHMFVEVFPDGRRMAIYFESEAVEAYTQKGIATPNEIIAEIMKVPKHNRNETDMIKFRNTNKGLGIIKNGELVDDVLDANTLGYNRTRLMGTDYNHSIIMNPRLFKGSKGKGAKDWIPDDENIIRWKKNMHHEFEHSGDETQELFKSDEYMPLCWSDEYSEVHYAERYFTEYANSDRAESWAEHGGYISYMEANPSEQHRLIKVTIFDEEKGFIEKMINYAEYKERYPKHYEFFMKKHKGEMKFNVLK